MIARPGFKGTASAALALVAVSLASTAASGQRPRPEPVPRVMIATFQSTDKELGQQVAEVLRTRVGRDAPAKDLTVIPKADINNTLQASGYSITEALAPNDAKALANLIRANEYIDGVVSRTPTGFRIESRLVLARDNQITQALPPAEAARLDQAAAAVSRAYLDARKQIPHENNCFNAARGGRIPEAIQIATEGLRQHPNANMIRVCLARAFVARDTPAGSSDVVSPTTLHLAEQVLLSDRRSVPALTLAALGYKAAALAARERNDTAADSLNEDKYIQTLTALLAADPNDMRLQQQVVNELAASGRAQLAVPIIKDALRSSSGDPQMLRTAWLVLLAARDYETAVQVGADLIVADTGAATANFYTRLAGAYAGLNRPQDALTVLESATVKFPNDAGLWIAFAENSRKAGQMQQALRGAQRAVSIDPSMAEPYVIMATVFSTQNQPDSVYMTLQRAPRTGPTASLLAQFALQQGDVARRAGEASKDRSLFQRAIRFLELSHQLEPGSRARFLLAASAFSLGQSAITDALPGRSCELARLAQRSFAQARDNIPAGREEFPEAAAQLTTGVGQYEATVTSAVRQFCR